MFLPYGGRVWGVNKGWNWKTAIFPSSGHKMKRLNLYAKLTFSENTMTVEFLFMNQQLCCFWQNKTFQVNKICKLKILEHLFVLIEFT